MLPVTVLSSMDPVLRSTTGFGAVVDRPGTLLVTQDLDPRAGTVRHVAADAGGVVEESVLPLQHTCTGCAVREDALPTLELVAGSGRWQHVVWALPVSASAAPLTTALDAAGDALGVVTAAVVAVVDGGAVVDDVFGDDLLVDRDLQLGDDDRRAVGEALASQLRHADLVLRSGSDPVGDALLDHLRSPGVPVADTDDGVDVTAPRYHPRRTPHRLDPLHVAPSGAADTADVWTLDLFSRRPFHPVRLLQAIEQLGTGALCGRGRFVLASRPGAVLAWDGAGGQLSVGDTARRVTAPTTRLVVTGTGDPGARRRVRESFARVLLRDDERAARWRGGADGFDPWLGEHRTSA